MWLFPNHFFLLTWATFFMKAEHRFFYRTISNPEGKLWKKLIQWLDYASCYYLHFTLEETEILMCNFHSISGQETQKNLSQILRLVHHDMTESDTSNIHSVLTSSGPRLSVSLVYLLFVCVSPHCTIKTLNLLAWASLNVLSAIIYFDI